VNASYRLGIMIVAGTVLFSAGLVTVGSALTSRVSGRPAEPVRAGRDLGDLGFDLGSYRLTERSGRAVTEADLAGDVWVADFIFTRCPSSCPRITSVMKGLQGRLQGTSVRLVSLSVDPEFDTPEVLTRYARSFGADPDRWWFLTGKESEIYDLILNRFHISVAKTDESAARQGAEAVAHSARLVLVDRGNTAIGVFDSDDPKEVDDLVARARRKASWARPLPAVNATLNGTCALLLMLGWFLIMTRRVRGHAACMISAVVVSALFLASYLLYHFEAGSMAFRGQGALKATYLSILLSHTLLATFGVVPLVTLTLIRAIRGNFQKHAEIARVTFPIWLYVSITGVIIYWMLYQMPISSL
jgi:protein SCO1/2